MLEMLAMQLREEGEGKEEITVSFLLDDVII